MNRHGRILCSSTRLLTPIRFQCHRCVYVCVLLLLLLFCILSSTHNTIRMYRFLFTDYCVCLSHRFAIVTIEKENLTSKEEFSRNGQFHRFNNYMYIYMYRVNYYRVMRRSGFKLR